MICIYHNRDMDGFCSGAIVRKKYPEAVMIGYDYGEKFPWERIENNGPVIMVDVSLPIEEMRRLAVLCAPDGLTWIDHHKSAIETYDKFCVDSGESRTNRFLTPVLQIGVGACELAWNYLFMGKEIPLAVQLLSEYDVFSGQSDDVESRWMKEVLPFQYGIRLRCNSLKTFPAVGVFDEDAWGLDEIIAEGCIVLKYQKQYAELLCRGGAFECELLEHSAICLNGGYLNSLAFDSVYDEVKHDIMVLFFRESERWKVSLYTKKDWIDVSEIAKHFGGGGHKKAAGFTTTRIDKILPGCF